MRKLVYSVVATFIVASSAMASYPGQIEKTVIYYEDDNYRQEVGNSTFYCDGTIVTEGLVTSSVMETYHGC